jgi:3-methyladenine DNA glycosylase AlkD
MSAPAGPEAALATLEGLGDAQTAEKSAVYHKAPRRYLGVANPVLDELVRGWRHSLPLPDRLSLAAALWDSDIFEGRVAAAKLLTQARIRDDAAVWDMICDWLPGFDCWAIADHACIAGQKRLVADPSRLDVVEGWAASEHPWTQRAALVITLPWARLRHPKPDDLLVQERVLGWAEHMIDTPDPLLQKALAWWLRELSRREPERVRDFLTEHGKRMQGSARREASKYLPRIAPEAAPEHQPDAPDDDAPDHSSA